MANPSEEDEFQAYRAQRRGGAQGMDSQPDEFAAYQASRGRKKGASGGPKMSFKDVIQTQTRQGLDWGLTDEAKGMQSLMGLPEWAGDAVNKLLVGAPVFNIGTGIAGLVGEAQAPKGETGTGAYYDARDAERAKVNQAWEDRPVTSFGAQLAGSAAYPGGALKPGAPLIKETLKMAFLGAMQGGAYGYSSAEGDTQDRADAAKMGAAFGGAAGGAMPAGSAVLRVPFRAAKGLVADTIDAGAKLFGVEGKAGAGHAEQVARAAVLRSMERSGMKPEDVLKAIDEFGDKPAVLAEVIGQDAVNALTALTRRPGSTPQKAQAIIEDRFGGFVDRAQNDLERTTGFNRANLEGNVDQEIARRQAAAAPIYEGAFGQFQTITSPKLKALETSPLLQSAMEKARKNLANEAAIAGKKPEQMSQLQYWDLVKRELDDAYDAAVAQPGGAEKGRQVELIRQAVVGQLDAYTGGTGGPYAQARAAGGEAPRLKQAFAEGSQALGSRPASEIQSQVNALNPQDAPYFKAGMTSNIANRIDKGMTPQRFRVKDIQNKVRSGLGEEEGSAFLKAMEAEAKLRETGARWAPRMNSVTGTVLESSPSQLADDAISGATALLRGDKIGAIRTLVNVMRRRGFSQKQIDAMGDLLLSDPREGLKRLGIRTKPNAPPGQIGKGFGPSMEMPQADWARNFDAQSRFPADVVGHNADGTAIFRPGSAGDRFLRGQSGSAQSGFTTDMASAAAGSVGGSIYGSQNDLNGDGVIDDKDAQIGALGGLAAGGLGSAALRGANRIGRAPLGAPTQYRVRPGESGTFNVQSRAGGQRWQRDNYPFATAKEAQAEIASRQGGNAPAWKVDDAITAVRNSKTPQEFWDNVRTIPEGPQRDGVMREMLKRAQSAEERSIVLDKFMGAASDWTQRERIARQFLRDHPLEWEILYNVWPSNPMDPVTRTIDGVPSLMEMVSDEAPEIAKKVMTSRSAEEKAWSGLLNTAQEMDNRWSPRLATDNGAPVPQPERPQAPTADIVPFRKPEPPKMSGINALAGPAGGAFTGGVMPIPSTGDPEQDRNNRLMAIAGGALAGSRTGRRAIQDVAQAGPPKLPKIRQDVMNKAGTGPTGSRRLGRGLDEIMADQQPPRAPRPQNALSEPPAPPPQGSPANALATPSRGGGLSGALKLGLPVAGGAAALYGLSHMANGGQDAPRPAAAANEPQTLQDMRSQLIRHQAKLISDGIDTGFTAGAVERLDALISYEAGMAARQPGPPELENQRAELVLRIGRNLSDPRAGYFRPDTDRMFEQLKQLDALIAQNPAQPGPPSMKPLPVSP